MRSRLAGTVYNHRAALSIGAMITDAFLEADSTLKISDSISDPTDFMTMTDSLVPIIERSKDSSLASARKIIHRLRRRQLYRFVDEVLLPAGASRRISPEEITTCQDASTGVNLVPRDIYIAHVTLNFGMKSKNPVDNVLFFKDWYVEISTMDLADLGSTKAAFLRGWNERYAFIPRLTNHPIYSTSMSSSSLLIGRTSHPLTSRLRRRLT